MDTRRVQKRIDALHVLATELGLSQPLGRAIWLESRAENSGGFLNTIIMGYANHKLRREDLSRLLEKVRPDVAERWYQHYDNGGSIRSLNHTPASYRAAQNENRNRIAAYRRQKRDYSGEHKEENRPQEAPPGPVPEGAPGDASPGRPEPTDPS